MEFKRLKNLINSDPADKALYFNKINDVTKFNLNSAAGVETRKLSSHGWYRRRGQNIRNFFTDFHLKRLLQMA
jgi:hypothetical protein